MTPLPSDITVAPADRDQQARDLVRALRLIEVVVWLDETGVHARPMSKLNQEMRDEIEELKPELVELLGTEGTEDVFTLDAEEKQHSDRNTPPRQAAEVDADARSANAAAAKRRSYQNGTVIVNGLNSMGRHMRLLREQREATEAAEDGTLPLTGRYQTRFDIF